MSLGVFKYSKNHDLAKKFLAWPMEKEQASAWIAASDAIHASLLRAFENDPFWSSDPKCAPL